MKKIVLSLFAMAALSLVMPYEATPAKADTVVIHRHHHDWHPHHHHRTVIIKHDHD